MNRFIAALCAMLSFSFAVWSLAWGWADLGSVSARLAMAGWEKARAPVDPRVWTQANARLRWARGINPFDADVSADLGRLHEWQALQGPVDSEYARAYRRQAVAYYEEAIAKRRTWGLAWANLARNEIFLDGLTDSAGASLGNAARLAPWDPDVQELIIWLGLALWEELPPELRGLVAATVERAIAIDNRVDVIVGIAVQYGWLDQLRPMLEEERYRRLLDSRLGRSS